MPFKNFTNFIEVGGEQLLPSDYLVGYREFNNEIKTRISDLTIQLVKNLDLKAAPEVLYVNTAGKDTNSGRSDTSAFRTIKRACAKALEISRAEGNANTAVEQLIGNQQNGGIPVWGVGSKQVNIFVRTGDYLEDNPIYLPPCCTIIGDNLRAVSVIPKNRRFDIFWVNHKCYIWGVTFRRHLKPSFGVAYPEFRILNNQVVSRYTSDQRVIEAKIAAVNDVDSGLYSPTRNGLVDLQNLSSDIGDAVNDPFEVAFLNRYFQGLNNTFYTEDEFLENIPFYNTFYYNNEVRKPYVLTSPYPQGNSSITQASTPGANDAGGGVFIDGYKVDGPIRSMVMDSYTQFNEGGPGIVITNNGYAQLVSTFTICCTEGVKCTNGGTCSINTSNCSFGLSGLVALGKSPNPTLIGKLSADITGLSDRIFIKDLGIRRSEHEENFRSDFQPYPGQVFQIVFSNGTGQLSATNSGSFFTALSCTKIEGTDALGYSSQLVLENNYSPITDSSIKNNDGSDITIIPANSDVYFYIRSTITTSAHTMEYIGTGTILLSAVPQKGGQTDTSTEAVFDDIGRVFFTSTNQFGDFRIGRDLTIVQATGTIAGETFERSILQIVTPFTIALASTL